MIASSDILRKCNRANQFLRKRTGNLPKKIAKKTLVVFKLSSLKLNLNILKT